MPQQNLSIDEILISYEEQKKEKEMLYMLLAQIQNLRISYFAMNMAWLLCDVR